MQKKAIVIGGSSGIGKALVKVLLSHNYKVGLSGIARDDLSELIQENSNSLIVKYIDCSEENCSVQINDLVNELGGMDLMIFSAGIGHLNKDLGFPAENKANKVNVLGFTEVVDWSYRYFANQGFGHLVAISSLAGLFGFRTTPAYTAAKGYQINYLEALRQKAHKSKKAIYVTDVRPGFVDTDINKDLKKIWVATPEKAALQIFNAIEKRKGIVYITKRFRLFAIVLALMPNWLRSRL